MMPLAAHFVDGPDGAVYSRRLDPPLQLSYTVMLPYRKPLPVLGNSFAVLPLTASVLTKNAAHDTGDYMHFMGRNILSLPKTTTATYDNL